MNLNECQLRSMYLAGTVAIPLTFPELGTISLGEAVHGSASPEQTPPATVVRVEHRISPKLMIARSVLLEEVEAVFLPCDPAQVDYARGDWLFAAGVGPGLQERTGRAGQSVLGIVYVHEHARVLMHVEVGMTAAESAEYYPPLAGDRSVNHYRLAPEPVCGRSEMACGPFAESRASFWCQ